MSALKLMRLSINGRSRDITVTPQETLLDMLRDRLDLTGSKRGCNQGVCGACTVLIDGEPMRACLSLALDVEGMEVVTVEGLGSGNTLTVLQQAIIEHGAVQCGFCVAGMLITAHALLRDNPHPSPEEVRAALAGNLCRCSGYGKIIEAVCRAAEEKAA